MVDTGAREEWRGQLAEMQFIVPSPMSAVEGRTQEGKLSPRCLENTGPCRFLVLEFDGGEADTHAAVLWHLARLAPLALDQGFLSHYERGNYTPRPERMSATLAIITGK